MKSYIKHFVHNISVLLIFIIYFLEVSGCKKDNDIYITTEIPSSINMIYDQVKFDEVTKTCKNSSNYGKTVGVFGGSLSVNSESLAAKSLWSYYLKMPIYNYGIGGYGFSSLQGSIQDQVDKANSCDIYILWCSTNDYTASREAGEPTDYTPYDNYDKTKLATQCGGLNYCIKKLREINSKAKIYVFTSLKFWETESGYEETSTLTNKTGFNFYHYVELQKKVAEMQNIKYFDQFSLEINKYEYKDLFYKTDAYHMTETGYANIGLYQLEFLSNN